MTTILSAPREWLESSPTRWYVVFTSGARRHWWDRVFRTPIGFSHVYALRWDGYNWILFNPHTSFTEIAILPIPTENAIQHMIEPGATVLEVEAFRHPTRIRGRWWIGPMTCVEQVKALLGIPVGRIWTPRQLYNYLVTDGQQQTENTGANRHRARSRSPVATRVRSTRGGTKPVA